MRLNKLERQKRKRAQAKKARERARAWYDNPANRNRVLARLRKQRTEHPERERATNRRRAGLPEPTRPEPPVCECCGGPPDYRKALSLDHCHVTGVFRGWLCGKCNTAIGKLGDDKPGLLRAVAYLDRASSP